MTKSIHNPFLQSHDIFIGPSAQIDPSALVGYLTGRKLADSSLHIGQGAVIRSGSVIYIGTKIGDGLQTGHNVVIREQNTTGDFFQIWNGSTVDYGCTLGNHVKIHTNCYLAQFTTLEDEVFMAPGVTIANDIHPGCEFSGDCMKGPTLKKGCHIGVNVTILPYITIGEKCLIGSGSVVTKDIPPETVAYGNPARVMGSIYDFKCKKPQDAHHFFTDQPYHRK